MRPNVIDLRGKSFGRLTPLSYVGDKRQRWECLCECGATTLVAGGNLRNGHTKSCGCLRNDAASKRSRKHGLSKTAEYATWHNMRSRCLDTTHESYKDYGGRGISICDRWSDFELFIADMGFKPDSNNTLDRIDSNGNYTPENCRWAGPLQQAINKRPRKRSLPTGITKQNNKWYASIGAHRKSYFLGSFDTLDDAVNAREKGEIKYWGALTNE